MLLRTQKICSNASNRIKTRISTYSTRGWRMAESALCGKYMPRLRWESTVLNAHHWHPRSCRRTRINSGKNSKTPQKLSRSFPEAFGSEIVPEGPVWPTRRAPWRQSSTRLNNVLWHERLNLALSEVLRWFDFMKDLTTPLTNIETNTMFWSSRTHHQWTPHACTAKRINEQKLKNERI